MKYFIYSVLVVSFLPSCKKDFLKEKPSSAIIKPTTLEEYQSILDNASYLNNVSPSLQQLGSDEYFIPDPTFYNNLPSLTERNASIWAPVVYGGETVPDWSTLYRVIFYANNVLDGITSIESNNHTSVSNIKGWSHFLRAFAYYDLVKVFSLAYDESTSRTDLGLPMRLSADVDQIKSRSSVQDTYDQIISDLTTAKEQLSENFTASNRNRPSKSAAHALLSRVFLSMRKYDLAEKYADTSLNFYNKLIDYNSLDTSQTFCFTESNIESIYYSTQLFVNSTITYLWVTTAWAVDSTLINLYDLNDLRLSVQLRKNEIGLYQLKGTYSGNYYPFTGLATDELYLIKAECAARRNELDTSLSYLNTLLLNRYKKGTFVPISTASSSDLLQIILKERRKELLWRGTRWADLKRLNKEGASITLTRMIGNEVHTLAPNDLRYAFPIPDEEISLSGIAQNPR